MNEYTVSDTFDFLDTISTFRNAHNYVMVSIDIVSLYTTVPVHETIDILIKLSAKLIFLVVSRLINLENCYN